MLKKGTHVDLVGAYTPAMREADDAALTRGRLFVDSFATTVGHIGEVMIPMQAGVIAARTSRATCTRWCRAGPAAVGRRDHGLQERRRRASRRDDRPCDPSGARGKVGARPATAGTGLALPPAGLEQRRRVIAPNSLVLPACRRPLMAVPGVLFPGRPMALPDGSAGPAQISWAVSGGRGEAIG
jgi:hypothetical protein